GEFPRGDRGDALSAAGPQRQAAAAAVERAQAGHAHRLPPVRHGRMAPGEAGRAQWPDDLFLDDPGEEAIAMAKPLTVEVASDVICPWCYIGKRRLEKALELLEGSVKPEIRWLPFQLNPDMPAQGMARADYRKAKFGSVERGRELDARVAAEGRAE